MLPIGADSKSTSSTMATKTNTGFHKCATKGKPKAGSPNSTKTLNSSGQKRGQAGATSAMELAALAIIATLALIGILYAVLSANGGPEGSDLEMNQIELQDFSELSMGFEWASGMETEDGPQAQTRNQASSDTLSEFFTSTPGVAFEKVRYDSHLNEVAYRLATGTSEQSGSVPMSGAQDQLVTKDSSTDAPVEEEEYNRRPASTGGSEVRTSEDTRIEVTIDRLGNILLPGVIKLPHRPEIASKYSNYMNSDPGQPGSRRLDRWTGFGSPTDAVYGPYADESFWHKGLRAYRNIRKQTNAASMENTFNSGVFSHRR
ncbi:unnamed protein product [Amoebophrya sp. A120]|nr:unnamed protein product [Amoebophrya sp. A120]|eukprot:GSA120T00016694001.1